MTSSEEIKYKTFLLLTLFVSIFSYSQEVVVGKINPIQGNAILIESKNEQGQPSIFRLQYQNKTNGNGEDHKIISFSANQAEFDFLFDQIKEVFRIKEEKTLLLDKSVKVTLRLITNTDLNFIVYQDEVKQGAFSTSATGFHLLFGMPWDKQAWSTYLKQ
jgi:hypothetical protein